jgi:nitrogen fixation/metabolism regulation signal transduction histidine kinase
MRLISSWSNRTTRVALLAIFLASLAGALFIGVADNPPGIVLLYVASAAFILTFVHTWRDSKRFVILLIASLVGLIVFAVLHNVFYGLADATADNGLLHHLMTALSVLFFLLAILVCPPGILIGGIGTALLYRRRQGSPH